MLHRNVLGAALLAGVAKFASAAACPACNSVNVDVVVLGGGAAGSYVAAQLTDIHSKDVLVVDAASRLVGFLFKRSEAPDELIITGRSC